MKSREMADYVPLVRELADEAVCFLQAQGIVHPESWSEPELRLSLEKRTKLYGIYNKRNVAAELERLLVQYKRFDGKQEYRECGSFLEKLANFLAAKGTGPSGFEAWKNLQEDFSKLERLFTRNIADMDDWGMKLQLWQKLVRLYAKVQQLEIKQQLSGVFNSEGRVVIYMNNIEAICQKLRIALEPYLQSVLVHEYAHACHYAAFMDAQSFQEPLAAEKALLRWSGAYFSRSRVTVVKESLARYMQISWCRENVPKLAEMLTSEQMSEFVIYPNWPYAGAQILLEAESSIGKALFIRVFKTSLCDWEQAYDILSGGHKLY